MPPPPSPSADDALAEDRLAKAIEEATDGDLVIETKLGEGRTGVVYVAHQSSLGRKVAVKAVHPRHSRDSGTVIRFKREARAMAGCPHPAILSVFNVGETKTGIPFFVMDLIEGETLEQRLERKGKIPLGETVRIVTSVADALTYANARGLVHRDVKPANILIESGTGRILMADFGLAKSVSGGHVAATLTGIGQIIGTPPYLSPEQAESGVVDARSDQYSLAVVTYEMLSGELPFPGPEAQDYVRQHAEDTAPSLSRLEPELPLEVSRVIERALMKEPGARFSNAEAFGQALRGAASTEVVRVPAGRATDRKGKLRLVQAAAIYAGAGWGFLEALSWLLETFGLPMAFRQPALWLVIAGFPVVMGLTWYLTRPKKSEVTPADAG